MTDIAPHPPRLSEAYDHEPEHAINSAMSVDGAGRPASPASPPAVGAEDTHPLVPPQPPMDSEKVAGDVKSAEHGLAGAGDVKKGPKVNLRILVISGQNHVYTFEPETTIGRVKELIWNMWPADWTKEPSLPATPSYFRILYLGRLLADDQTLKGEQADLDFKLDPYITIVHLSVRTFPISDEEPKKSIFSLTRPSASRANSAIVQSQAAQTPNRTAAAANTPTSGRNRRAGANPTGNTATARNSGDGEHGGGCKCVIM